MLPLVVVVAVVAVVVVECILPLAAVVVECILGPVGACTSVEAAACTRHHSSSSNSTLLTWVAPCTLHLDLHGLAPNTNHTSNSSSNRVT